MVERAHPVDPRRQTPSGIFMSDFMADMKSRLNLKSTSALARQIGKHPAYLSNIVKRGPQVETLWKLMLNLGIDLDEKIRFLTRYLSINLDGIPDDISLSRVRTFTDPQQLIEIIFRGLSTTEASGRYNISVPFASRMRRGERVESVGLFWSLTRGRLIDERTRLLNQYLLFRLPGLAEERSSDGD